ncbi:MAG: CRISPR-associated endonuclease Cas2, partial [Candidatus Berkelbacteria bacterium]|nr:CRISPR-associated endonuclease Cas2 [Candidatus Berkelbacteria bacterium]
MRADLEREHKLSQIVISEDEEWDGWWHLVSYDIPNIYKKSRDLLRSHLERLGFKRVQESLWVFPYECQEEIALIANEISVSNNIIYMSTEKLPNEESLKAYFGLDED